jgi:sec-independent protein translocase protein TatB
MFGLGTSEIIIIVIVALVLINPKDLPRIVRKIGKIYGKVMREINGVRKTYGQFEKEVKYLADFTEEKNSKKGEKK